MPVVYGMAPDPFDLVVHLVVHGQPNAFMPSTC